MDKTKLYRHFDKDNKLLYVGISYDFLKRTSQHRLKSGWWDNIANMTVESFRTRKEAEEAEYNAIIKEKPLHNIAFTEKSSWGGSRKGSGRKKGTQNKLTNLVKKNVIEVFNSIGGKKHMIEWAKENPTQFYRLFAKILPKEDMIQPTDLEL